MMKKLNPQEMVDKVARHLHAQGQRCINDEGACCFRLVKDGVELRCAVGALLPDGPWLTSTGTGLYTLEKMFPEMQAMFGSEGDPVYELAAALQCVHDMVFPVDWPRELRKECRRRHLSTAVIDELWGVPS